MNKVIVIGAGPAGIMSALKASENNEVVLIDKNNEIGKKLKITGGGRCNITNNRYIEDFFDKVINNKKFLYSSLYSFTNEDMLKFLSQNNVKYKIEKDEKVYTHSDKSDEIINVFMDSISKNNIKLFLGSEVEDLVVEEDTVKGIILKDGQNIDADKVIVATGGKSYPGTGSSGEMFEILKKYHKIEELHPALIPLVVKEEFIKKLQGIAIQDINATCKIKKKKISLNGDILFAHFGITGPVILNLSSYITKQVKNDAVEIILDLVPTIDKDQISKTLREHPTKNVQNNVKGLLPQNFIKILFEHLGLSDVKASDLSKKDEEQIISNIKELKLTCIGTKGISAGIVTSGGVSTKEINASTMESKKIKNLYFAGEVIDVDAETGGYNLQIAYSTGYLAGMSV